MYCLELKMFNFSRALSGLVIVLAFVFAGFCADVEDDGHNLTFEHSVDDANSAASVISFEQLSYDIGEVGPESVHNFSYKFTNTGQGTLKITRVHAPCGCTTPELKKKSYEPGESGQIDVRFKAPKPAGAVLKHIYVYTNQTDEAKAELEIKCNVVLRVKAEPEILQLSLIEKNGGAKDITLTSLDGKPFGIKNIIVGGNVATFEYDKGKQATEFVVKPIFDTEKLANNLDGVINFELDHPDCSAIMVRYTAPADFIITPRALIQTNADPENPEVRTLWITSNYNKDLKIESIKSSKGTVEVVNKEFFGNRLKLDVKIAASAEQAKRRYHSDELLIKIVDGPELKVRCQQWFAKKAS
jgi:hypothetical protein